MTLARKESEGWVKLPRLGRARLALASAFLLWLAASSAGADAINAPPLSAPLTATGTQLATLRADPKSVDISRSVPLAGDVPIASYIAFRPASTNSFFQRNDLGAWVLWDGKIETLINNGYQPANGVLGFVAAAIDLSPYMFPLTVIIAYWTGSELKVGQFDVESLP